MLQDKQYEPTEKFILQKEQETSRWLIRIRQCLFAWISFCGILFAYMFCIPEVIGGHLISLAGFGCFLILLCFALTDRLSLEEHIYFIPVLVVLASLVAGPGNVVSGFLGVLNRFFDLWNQKYEGDLHFYQSMVLSERNIVIFSYILIALVALLLWKICASDHLASLLAFLGVVTLVSLLVGRFWILAFALPVVSFVGQWVYSVYSGAVIRRLWPIAAMVLVLLAAIVFWGKSESPEIGRLRASCVNSWQQFRYGDDSLPKGDLSKAGKMLKGDTRTLHVTTDQVKSMYFRGFVGTDYADGKWSMISNEAFENDRVGMKDWLKQRGVSGTDQFGQYMKITYANDDTFYENHVEVKNSGANRKYIYMPMSVAGEEVKDSFVKRDATTESKKFRGSKTYSYVELSEDKPAEIIVAEKWVKNPETEEEKAYADAESVYRGFVYENYLTVNPEIEPIINSLFWSEAKPEEKEGVYASTQRIRDVLSSNNIYETTVGTVPDETDPLSQFLTREKKGNSVLFASAAVEAYRANGIPARYVEGYYMPKEMTPSGDVWLTTQNAHAWVEVYMDAVGWVPIDVTPGFYYDSYTLMEMFQLPRGIEKTAAVEDGKEQASNAPSDGTNGRSGKKHNEKKQWLEVLLGLFVILMCLLVSRLVYLGIRRVVRMHKLQKVCDLPPSDEKTTALCEAIIWAMSLLGMNIQTGFRAEEIENALCEKVTIVEKGEYLRVNEIIEKYLFGGIHLETYEQQVLVQFVEKICECM